ncbi:MAG: DNA polymerase subunit beta [Methanocellales archaeon]
MLFKFRLRDFIITKEDWIFSIVDYHPEGESLRCLLRYIPSEKGERVNREGRRFKKLDFEEAYAFLEKFKPSYVKDVHIVPFEDVKLILHSDKALRAVEDPKVTKLIELFTSKGIPQEKMGITGSRLCGLAGEKSDIDFIVYGGTWYRAREILIEAKKKGLIEEVSSEMWHAIYEKRKPELSYEEFLVHELRKANRGMIDGTYFDLLYVRDWEEIGPALGKGIEVRRDVIEARVLNTYYAFDSPAIYDVEHEEVKQVLSYTHTYAGQALPGEIIEASGKIEQFSDGRRMIVGSTREARGEWIKSLTLLKGKRDI